MYPLRIYFFSSCTDVLTPTRSVLLFVVLATGDFLLNNRDLFLVKESIVIETGTLILLNNSYVILSCGKSTSC